MNHSQWLKRFRATLVLFGILFSAHTHAGFVYALIEGGSGLRIRGFSLDESTGVLTPIAGLVPLIVDLEGQSDGLSPTFVSELLAVDRSNKRLYALNRLRRSVAAFSIDATTGALTALPFSPIQLPAMLGTPSTVKVNPSGTVLAVTEYGSSSLAARVATFLITSDAATPAVGSPFAAQSFSRSATFSYTGDFLYTSNVNGFSVNQNTAVLTPITGVASTYPWGLSADASGRVFSVTTLLGEVKVSPADNTGTLTDNYNWPPSNVLSPLAGAYGGTLSPDGRFYAVASPGRGEVGILSIRRTALSTALALVGTYDSPQGTFTQLLTYNDTGSILIAGDNPAGDNNRLTTWFADPQTGALATPTSTPQGALGGSDNIRGVSYFSGPRRFQCPVS
jgi:hypothetical protein